VEEANSSKTNFDIRCPFVDPNW